MMAQGQVGHLDVLYKCCFDDKGQVLWHDLMGLVWYASHYQRAWALRVKAEKKECLSFEAVELAIAEAIAKKNFESALADFREECEREGIEVPEINPFNLSGYEFERRRGR
ncbi:MAG: hypothetical protein PHS53_05105 [Candidatus Pacebacteria bacterium]|nr:hypothetical protein [Candidatus Paceibacterota bacterium]